MGEHQDERSASDEWLASVLAMTPEERSALVAAQSDIVWVPDPSWVMGARGPGRCRWGAAPGIPACGAPAVASMQRTTRWYDYCADHLYGARIVDIDGSPTVCRASLSDSSRPTSDQTGHAGAPSASGDESGKDLGELRA